MKCPICKSVELIEHALPEGPASHRCAQCGGQWVESKRYWAWLETPGRNESPAVSSDANYTVVDSIKAKICPECGHLLSRAKVGHGANFHIDRCAHCGGIWFDALEWESLRALGLHDDVHFIFSKASAGRDRPRSGARSNTRSSCAENWAMPISPRFNGSRHGSMPISIARNFMPC